MVGRSRSRSAANKYQSGFFVTPRGLGLATANTHTLYIGAAVHLKQREQQRRQLPQLATAGRGQ